MENFKHVFANISRNHLEVEIPLYLRYVGTENCEVRFRMTHEQEQQVRQHFKTPDHLNIQFCSSEVVEIGNGWYLAFSLTSRPDEALKAILNIKAALYYARTHEMEKRQAQQQLAKITHQVAARVRPQRVLPVRYERDQFGNMVPVTIDRLKQALSNPLPIRHLGGHELDHQIKSLMDKLPAQTVNVQQLAHHFGK